MPSTKPTPKVFCFANGFYRLTMTEQGSHVTDPITPHDPHIRSLLSRQGDHRANRTALSRVVRPFGESAPTPPERRGRPPGCPSRPSQARTRSDRRRGYAAQTNGCPESSREDRVLAPQRPPPFLRLLPPRLPRRRHENGDPPGPQGFRRRPQPLQGYRPKIRSRPVLVLAPIGRQPPFRMKCPSPLPFAKPPPGRADAAPRCSRQPS